MMRLLLPFAVLLLSACQTTGEPPPPEPLAAPMLKDIVPKELLKCLPEPNGQRAATARQVALFITDLKGSGRDCRRKLKTVRGLIEGETR